MDVPSANFPPEIEPSKNINLFNLDKNIAHIISRYLTDKDLVNICFASKNMHSIFYPSLEKRLMSVFLKYVVEGRLDKVEGILKRNKKLVFLHGDITDLSGREFKRITAFQYATWVLDKEMWELILKHLPETAAYSQLMAFEQGRSDITQIHGTRFNFAPLLDAYQKYMDNYDGWRRTSEWNQIEACWCKEVGGAQRQMPAWFVYIFCEEGADTAWLTNDFNKNFTRDPQHLSWWFDQEYNSGTLGAAARVQSVLCRASAGLPSGLDRLSLLSLTSCQAERTSYRNLLNDYLKRAAERKNPSTTLNNTGK